MAEGAVTLRHAFIPAALDAGVPLRDLQEAPSHADPRTTMRYDRARVSLDRHATYIVAAFVAGAARQHSAFVRRAHLRLICHGRTPAQPDQEVLVDVRRSHPPHFQS